MAVVIDGTTGISTPAETVLGNLSYTGTLTGNGGIVNLGSGQVYKDASGNLGLGVTPSAWVSGDTILQVKAGSSITSLWGRNASGRLISNAYYDGTNYKYYATGTATSFETNVGGGYNWNIAASGTAGNAITFTQAMTLDSSGNLLVGTTSQLGTVTARAVFSNTANLLALQAGNGNVGAYMTNNSGTGNWQPFSFCNNGTSFTQIGSITTTASATAYNTSSDYRLKEAIAPMTGALAKVAALKPCTYKWKVDGSDGQGFIAHELAEVEAGCVTGEKDAVDAEGNPQYQGIDTSFLVATLAAAIQEQQAMLAAQAISINALNERLTALEGTAA